MLKIRPRLTKQVSNLPTKQGRVRAQNPMNERAIKVTFCMVIRNENFDFQVLQNNLLLIKNDPTSAELLLFICAKLLSSSVKKLIAEFATTLRVMDYNQGLLMSEMRNQQAQVARGEVLFFMNPTDKLGVKPSTYIYSQLTRSLYEEVIVVQRPLRKITQVGVLRNTFFELGGFDEQIAYTKQIANMMKRLGKYGVSQLNVKMDEAAWVGSLNFALFLVSVRAMKTEMSPLSDQIKLAE